jgi:hypothetical protein
MTIVAFVIGIFIGATLGVVVAALLKAGAE